LRWPSAGSRAPRNRLSDEKARSPGRLGTGTL
jgi:hypothetical protein